MQIDKVALALDVGKQRVGVARAHPIARIASPLVTLNTADTLNAQIADLVAKEDAGVLVVGLPRGMQGQDTEQTQWVQDFCKELQQVIPIPIIMQDEALTSVKAEAELNKRGKPFAKGDVDALAATYILEDYLSS